MDIEGQAGTRTGYQKAPDFARLKAAGKRRTVNVLEMKKPRLYGAFDGGRTRDRTLDLSRVKGTLSR